MLIIVPPKRAEKVKRPYSTPLLMSAIAVEETFPPPARKPVMAR